MGLDDGIDANVNRGRKQTIDQSRTQSKKGKKAIIQTEKASKMAKVTHASTFVKSISVAK
jgi:hypothetical protein